MLLISTIMKYFTLIVSIVLLIDGLINFYIGNYDLGIYELKGSFVVGICCLILHVQIKSGDL